VVLLEHQAPLTEGTEVVVTPVAGACGTAASVLAAMEAAPKVPVEWVDELEQLIAAGRRPPTQTDPFLDRRGVPEGP
jgi:L-serine deaminase